MGKGREGERVARGFWMQGGGLMDRGDGQDGDGRGGKGGMDLQAFSMMEESSLLSQPLALAESIAFTV